MVYIITIFNNSDWKKIIMNPEAILFWSVFGGILASALVGVLSLIPFKVINNYGY